MRVIAIDWVAGRSGTSLDVVSPHVKRRSRLNVQSGLRKPLGTLGDVRVSVAIRDQVS